MVPLTPAGAGRTFGAALNRGNQPFNPRWRGADCGSVVQFQAVRALTPAGAGRTNIKKGLPKSFTFNPRRYGTDEQVRGKLPGVFL